MTRSCPSTDELRAAGVPSWAPRSAEASDGVFYTWNTSTGVDGYLFLSDGTDRSFTIHCLLDMIEEAVENDASNSPKPTDLDQSVAAVVVRTGGALGHGPLGQAQQDLRPLRDLLVHAAQVLTAALLDSST